jgi:hypothetical protein
MKTWLTAPGALLLWCASNLVAQTVELERLAPPAGNAMNVGLGSTNACWKWISALPWNN